MSTSNRASPTLPYEIWSQIFTQLHNPSIPSYSHPLCLVSRTFNALSDPIRIQSILLSVDFSESGLRKMETFLDGLIARRNEKRVFLHLFVRVYSSQADIAPISLPLLIQNRASWLILHHQLSDYLTGILRLTGHSLMSLTIFLAPFVLAPRIYKLTLPNLHELTFYICENQTHSILMGPSSQFSSFFSVFTSPSGVDPPSHCILPSLHTLNVLYAGDRAERNLGLSLIRTCRIFAPALVHLKVKADVPSLDLLRLSLGGKLGGPAGIFNFPPTLQQIIVEAVRVGEEAGGLDRAEEQYGNVRFVAEKPWRRVGESVINLEAAKQSWSEKVRAPRLWCW